MNRYNRKRAKLLIIQFFTRPISLDIFNVKLDPIADLILNLTSIRVDLIYYLVLYLSYLLFSILYNNLHPFSNNFGLLSQGSVMRSIILSFIRPETYSRIVATDYKERSYINSSRLKVLVSELSQTKVLVLIILVFIDKRSKEGSNFLIHSFSLSIRFQIIE